MEIRSLDRTQLEVIRPLWEALNAHHAAHAAEFKPHFEQFTFDQRTSKLVDKDHLRIFLAEHAAGLAGFIPLTSRLSMRSNRFSRNAYARPIAHPPAFRN